MSILDKEKVDGLSFDNDREEIRLLITDHLDWTDEYHHLLALQEKINAYIIFFENHQYKQVYKDITVKYAIIEIHFKYEVTKKAIFFLEQVQQQLNKIGMTIECHISEEK